MREGCEGGGKGPLIGRNLSHTLATRNDQTVAMNFEMFNVGHGIAPPILAERAGDTFLCLPSGQSNASATKDYCGALSCNHEAPIIGRTANNKEVFPTISARQGEKLFLGNQEAFSGDFFVLDDQGGSQMCVNNNVTGTFTASRGRAHQPVVIHGSQDPCVGENLANGVGTNNGLENIVCFENYPNDSRVKEHGDLSPTITLRAGTGGNNLPLVAYQPSQHHVPKESHVAMLTATNCDHVRGDTPIVCHAIEGNGSRPSHRGSGIGDDVSFTINTVERHGVAAGKMLRRLTPLECERLMGFPDDYTRIPWRGKPAGDCPDAPRYKACGNSWAVNCARWLCMRIAMVEGTQGNGREGT